MIIIFLGPPFSGKTTQAELLSIELGMPFFSMGNIIREAYRCGNPEAVEGFEKYSMRGKHVPISLKFSLLKEKLDKAKHGFILDNFPATKEDLDTFTQYLKEHSLSTNYVFHLLLTGDEIEKRMMSRGRFDDTPEVVERRLELQDKDRIPVLDYFRGKGILREVHGNGERSIDMIHQDIMQLLKA